MKMKRMKMIKNKRLEGEEGGMIVISKKKSKGKHKIRKNLKMSTVRKIKEF